MLACRESLWQISLRTQMHPKYRKPSLRGERRIDLRVIQGGDRRSVVVIESSHVGKLRLFQWTKKKRRRPS